MSTPKPGTTIARALELQDLTDRLDHCAQHGGTVTLSQTDAKAVLEGLAIYGLALAGRQKPGPKPKHGKARTPAERQRESRASKRGNLT